MNRLLLLAVSMGCAVVLTALLAAPSASALTLREAVEHTIRTNPQIGVTQAERRATGYELLQSKGRFLPQLDVEADVGHQKTASETEELTDGNNVWLWRQQVEVTASQILFDGWERHYDVYKNAARLDVAALRVLDTSHTTGLAAVEAYIDLRRQGQVIAVARRNVARHQEILELVRTQFEGGRVPLSEVNQIRSRLAAAEAAVALTRRQLLDAEARFRNVIGLAPRGTQPVGWPSGVPGSRGQAIAMASDNNPSIRAAVAGMDAAAHELNQQLGSFFPTVSLEGTARHSENINGNPEYDNEYTGKMVLRWSLFDGMIRHNRRRELIERVGAAQLRADVRRRDITQAVERAWAALVTGRDRVDSLTSQVQASTKVVGAFLEEYELTRRTLLEVLDAESLLFNARVQLIGAKSIRLFSAYQLLASTGTLLDVLGVAPPQEAVADAQAREIHHINAFDVFLEPLAEPY